MRRPSLLKAFKSKDRDRDISYDAVVDEVIDGDTVSVTLFTPGYPTVALRLAGTRAPEQDEIGGVETEMYLEDLLPQGTPIRVRNRDVWNYDRLIAIVNLLDGRFVNDMVQEFIDGQGYGPGRLL